MALVTDTLGANRNPPVKGITLAKVLSAVPTTSGAALTDTENFFLKDCPFALDVLSVKAVCRSLTTADFNGTGGAVTVTVQSSDEVNTSPAQPTTITWDALLSSTSIKDKATDTVAFTAPGDGTNVLDQTYASIPRGGSLRATLSAQVEDTYSGAGSTVDVLLIVECVPTDVKAKRYF